MSFVCMFYLCQLAVHIRDAPINVANSQLLLPAAVRLTAVVASV